MISKGKSKVTFASDLISNKSTPIEEHFTEVKPILILNIGIQDGKSDAICIFKNDDYSIRQAILEFIFRN